MDEYISKEQFVTHFRKLLCEDCNHRKGIKNGKLTNRFVYPIGGAMCRACEVDDMLDRVEDFEPADVAPVRHGKWIKENDRPKSWLFVCSLCGGIAYYPNPKFRPKGCGYKFCPNCGADMREE